MKGVSLEMYQDAHNLFNYGFEEYQNTNLVSKNTFVQNIKIQNGDSKEISVITESDFTTLLKKSASAEVKSNVVINEIQLPLEANDVIGKIEYSIDGEIIGSVNLITPIEVKSTLVESSGGGIFYSILKFLGTLVVFSLVALILLKVYNDIRIRINRKKKTQKNIITVKKN